MQLSHLHPSQRQAVLCVEGPLLVLAGAGSGKTRVITHRIQYLLSKGVKPEEIVAITFTNQAADEMRERLCKMVGRNTAGALVMGTFHALGALMMRSTPHFFDVPKRFSILDQGDVLGIIRSLLYEHGIHDPQGKRRFDATAIAQRISLWKNEFHDHAEVSAIAQGPDATPYDDVAAKIYSDYQERLHTLGALDFDDLVCRVAQTLDQNPEAKAHWNALYRYILVDEYQDTNAAQLSMVRGLLCDAQNVCVVGDDDQAIYGWRGAKVANILGFDLWFPRAETVKLEQNYRCRPDIVACANGLIQHNPSRSDKELIATRPEGEPVTLVECRDDRQECVWVSNKIRELVLDDGQNPGHIAVLYRSSRQATPIKARLEEHGLAFQVLGGQAFVDRKEVKDVLAYFKAMVLPGDDLAIRRALDNPSRGIGKATLAHLSHFAQEHGRSLSYALSHLSEIPEIASRPRDALIRFSSIVRQAQHKVRAGQSPQIALRELIEASGLKSAMSNAAGSSKSAAQRWNSVEWLFSAMERFEAKSQASNKKIDWVEFVRAIEAPRKEEEDSVDGVITLATMHSAKGLEWPFVFIIGAEEGTLPHKRVDAPRVSDAVGGDVEEERRLFYVAMTRARDRLWISRAEVRLERGREIEMAPSRFLEELPESNLQTYRVDQEEKLSPERIDALASAFLSKIAPASSSDTAK